MGDNTIMTRTKPHQWVGGTYLTSVFMWIVAIIIWLIIVTAIADDDRPSNLFPQKRPATDLQKDEVLELRDFWEEKRLIPIMRA